MILAFWYDRLPGEAVPRHKRNGFVRCRHRRTCTRTTGWASGTLRPGGPLDFAPLTFQELWQRSWTDMQTLLAKHWHHLPLDEVVAVLETDVDRGLDLFDIKHRQERFGSNVLTVRKGKSALVRFLLQFNNPLIYILLVSTASRQSSRTSPTRRSSLLSSWSMRSSALSRNPGLSGRSRPWPRS